MNASGRFAPRPAFAAFACLALMTAPAAVARSWQAPVDASAPGCYESVAQAALMDDGTLLVACTWTLPVGSYDNASLWQRGPDGRWQVVARPPTPTSRALSLRKVSGTQAIVTWDDRPPPRFEAAVHFQIWTSGAGAAAAFDIPTPADQPAVLPVRDSLGIDGRVVRIRNARPGESAPPAGGVLPSHALEVVGRDGAVAATLVTPPGHSIHGSAATCQFPSGDRLVAYRLMRAVPNQPGALEYVVHAAIHRSRGGWGAAVPLVNVTADAGTPPRAFCIADGFARVAAGQTQSGASVYRDLAGDEGWRPLQTFNSRSELAQLPMLELLFARSANGQAVFAWHDYRAANASGGAFQPGHQSIPRVQSLKSGQTYFTGDFAMPAYDPDALNDTAVKAVAWDPQRQRFVFVLVGGSAPAPRRVYADYSPGATWSAIQPLPPQMLESWALDFNATGDGVLLARRHGQLLISDWR